MSAYAIGMTLLIAFTLIACLLGLLATLDESPLTPIHVGFIIGLCSGYAGYEAFLWVGELRIAHGLLALSIASGCGLASIPVWHFLAARRTCGI
jgi:hypothetical protein